MLGLCIWNDKCHKLAYRLTQQEPTDRRTDGRTTCNRNTALCTQVHRAVKMDVVDERNVYVRKTRQTCWRRRVWCQSQHKTAWITFRGHSRSRILGSLKSRRCYAERGYATVESVRPSVCQSDRPSCSGTMISWSHRLELRIESNSKIILRLITLRFMLGLCSDWPSTLAIWSNGNTPKLGWNRGAVQKTAIYLKLCKIGPRLLCRLLIGSRIRAFDSYQNYDRGWPWMADTHFCRKDTFYGAHQKFEWR